MSWCFSCALVLALLAAPACFSGDTKVVVQGLKAPVAIRDLQTGHFVQCLDSGADLTQPSTVRWCEVANWLHAEAKQLLQTRIRFNRMGGSPGSITVSPTHMVLRLTSDAAAAPAGATAASVAACEYQSHDDLGGNFMLTGVQLYTVLLVLQCIQ